MSLPDEIAGVHQQIAHLSWLVGRWRGIGEGAYPGTEPFRYEEIVEFASDGRPFLEYRAVAWLVDDDNQRVAAAHTESGYWRGAPDNGVEAVLVHPTGFAESWLGSVSVSNIVNAQITGAKMELRADVILGTPTATRIDSGMRLYGLVNGELLMTYDKAADGHAEQAHRWIRMQRA